MNYQNKNISFMGKNEVFYGIKKLANEAATHELKRSMGMGPHPVNLTSGISESQGRMFAYADMILHDEFAKEGLKEATNNKSLINHCKDILTSDFKGDIQLNPTNVFLQSFNKIAKNIHDKDLINNLNSFIEKFKS